MNFYNFLLFFFYIICGLNENLENNNSNNDIKNDNFEENILPKVILLPLPFEKHIGIIIFYIF